MSKIQAFDYSVDLLRAILWQYNDAERLQALLDAKQSWYNDNQTAFWTDWYRDVFNLQTANDFGLSVWAIILDIPIVVTVEPSDPGKPTWGYGQYHKNYNNGNFSRRTPGAVHLTTEQSRTVLRMRYFQLTSRGTVPEINAFLDILFGDLGGAYVIDALDMSMIYVFLFALPSQLQFVFERYDILPRPAAVGVSYLSLPAIPWGFDEYNENFDNGNFFGG